VLAVGSSQDAFKRDAAAVPDHTIVVVPNPGHFVMIDDPDQFAVTLDHFLATHAPGPSVASR
jgi:pimeloyl-ACP methyl ester carboxylesterase